MSNSELWWYGPSWLHLDEVSWPSKNNLPVTADVSSEVKPISSINLATISTDINDIFSKYGKLIKLQPIFAYVRRFSYNCRHPISERETDNLQVKELDDSLNCLINIAQNQCFSSEIHDIKTRKAIDNKSKILSLNPFIADDGLLRVGGRIQESPFSYAKKHPIILPQHHNLTKLIAFSEHERLCHAGPQLLLAHLREKYWPINGKNLCKAVTLSCITCFKVKPKLLTKKNGKLTFCTTDTFRTIFHSWSRLCMQDLYLLKTE